jgi:TPP-dependent pyruvate/acetoin dehydrogenase alpha subunit
MFSEDHEKAWTEDDIIEFVTEELSKKKYWREQRIDQAMEYLSLSYLTPSWPCDQLP